MGGRGVTTADALRTLVEAIDYTRKTGHLRHPVSCYCSVNAALEDARTALTTPAPAAPAEDHVPMVEQRCLCGRPVRLSRWGKDPHDLSWVHEDHQPAPAAPAEVREGWDDKCSFPGCIDTRGSACHEPCKRLDCNHYQGLRCHPFQETLS